MARGRMVNNSICMDRRVADLSDDTCRLLFTWLVTWADREGRTYGDAAVVRSMVFPRHRNISVEQVDTYLAELHQAGLIVRYEIKDDLYIWFPGFEKNQSGLRKERESASILPPPPAQTSNPVRSNDGSTPEQSDGSNPDEIQSGDDDNPEQIPVKLKEIKLNKLNRKEGKGREETPLANSSLSIQEASQIWLRLSEALKAQVAWATFRSKIEPCQVIGVDDQVLQIRAPDQSACTWINGLFQTAAYQNMLTAVAGREITLQAEV